jgi:hypothetical protein
VKKQTEENCGQHFLAKKNLEPLLEKCDADLAEKCGQNACQHCGGTLHVANYPRKPRGGVEVNEEVLRFSFCCDQDGCRKRCTPPSVRFLGRRVYLGFVVVLVSAMAHGLTPKRLQVLQEKLGIDRRTLERWRTWWLENFVQSTFWKEARARFMPVLCESILPLSLCKAFKIDHLARSELLLKLLSFLGPLTTSSFPLK